MRRAYIRTGTHAHTYIFIHTCTHAHIHTYTHINIHIQRFLNKTIRIDYLPLNYPSFSDMVAAAEAGLLSAFSLKFNLFHVLRPSFSHTLYIRPRLRKRPNPFQLPPKE